MPRTDYTRTRLAAEALTDLYAACAHLDALRPVLAATDAEASVELARLLRRAVASLERYPVPMR